MILGILAIPTGKIPIKVRWVSMNPMKRLEFSVIKIKSEGKLPYILIF